MDRLKHSLEDREAPTCPTCGIEMQWCRSELVRFVPATNLHLFNCPTCFQLAESETVSEPVQVSPDNLAVAGFRFFCPGGIGGSGPRSAMSAVTSGLRGPSGPIMFSCRTSCHSSMVSKS